MALFLDHLLPETATGWQAGNLNLAVCSRYGLEFSSSCHRGYCKHVMGFSVVPVCS